EPGREAGVELGEVLPVAEAVSDLSQLVERVDAVVADALDPRRPAGVEREEGAAEVEPPVAAVAVLREPELRLRAAAEDAGILIAEEVRGAVDRRRALDVEVLAGAEEVAVREVEAGAADPAGVMEGDPALERPDVAGDDLDVDLALGDAQRPDPGIVEVAGGSQEALGLAQRLDREAVAALEQELALDRRRPGGAMEAIGELEDPGVLALLMGIEDVLVEEVDPADRVPRRLGADLFRGDGRRLGLLDLRGRRRLGAGTAGEEREGEERRQGNRSHLNLRDAVSIVIPSVSEGPGGRAGFQTLATRGIRATHRRGPSLSLGMTIGVNSACRFSIRRSLRLRAAFRCGRWRTLRRAATAAAAPASPPSARGPRPASLPPASRGGHRQAPGRPWPRR